MCGPLPDRYKLGLALIIEGVFNALDSHAGIELPTLSIVDDLDMFYSYPWGRVSYIHLIRGFRCRMGRTFVDATNKKEKAVTYIVHDFPIAMQVLHTNFVQRIHYFIKNLLTLVPSMFNSHLLSAVTDLGIRGNARNWGSVCSVIGSSIPMASELDVYQTAAATDLHAFATLRPTEAELGQPYISTLLPFEDRTVPALDDVARDTIPSQLHPEPLASGGNVGNSKGESALVSCGGGSEDDDESGDSDDEGAGEEIGGDKSGDSNGEASDEGDSEDEHTRTPLTGTYSTPSMHRCTSPIHAPSRSYVRQGQTSGVSLTRAEVRDFISTLVPPAPSRSTPPTAQAANEPTVSDGNGGETDPVPKCAEPQVHGRGFSPLPVDHDEDMDKKMQEWNGDAGMESEPALNDNDDDVASGGSGKREDERVASPTGVAEANGKYTTVEYFYFTAYSGCGMDTEPEKNSHDDEVPSSGLGNRLA
ncbi:Hypothetical predicted protein [Olea europaea subsp. europaea]|uniref:DUF1985 domain-containing protein n=1 Tax=Olea europaea subsp. europaea TaxID=158383 RepID=A0A8S0T853_OLEEU|nr:Hypothetical predicted protein [Olea europaea subsp. europaea]